MSRFRFSLRALLVFALGCGLLVFIVTSAYQRDAPVHWGSDDQQQFELLCRSGQSVLLRIEGHAGGAHQYAVAAAVIEAKTVNRELRKLDSKRLRVGISSLWSDEVMAEANVPTDAIPVLLFIPQGDLKRAVWQSIYDDEEAVAKFVRRIRSRQ